MWSYGQISLEKANVIEECTARLQGSLNILKCVANLKEKAR